MASLAYFIDPLLGDRVSLQEQAFLDAIPDLAQEMPGHRHYVLTTLPGISLDTAAGSAVELVSITLPRNPLMNRRALLQQAMQKWLQANGVKLFVTTDPDLVFGGAIQTVLFSGARNLLGGQHRSMFFGRKPAKPDWLKAARIILPYAADREALLTAFPVLDGKLAVVLPALQEPVPALEWSEQEQVKLRYSGGRDYFLFAGPLGGPHDLVDLLKSYSLLKKWLMTGMPVILAGPSTADTAAFRKLLDTYKYRSDVTVLEDPATEDLKELVAGAYALLWPAGEGAETWPLEWAMSAGTPVLTTETPWLREFCGGAGLLSAPGDIDQMAHHLMIVYKDETLRARLIEKGRDRASQIGRQLTLDQYRACLLELCGG